MAHSTRHYRRVHVAYIRRKSTPAGGDTYYQVVESVRVPGKGPRQKILVHLGGHKDVDTVLKRWPNEIGGLRRRGEDKQADGLKARLERLRELRAEGKV
jgi:hypothetical protein